jgi:hypothetical protein
MRYKTKSSSRIFPLLDKDNHRISDAKTIADILCNTFAKNYNNTTSLSQHKLDYLPVNDFIHSIAFTQSEICNSIKTLNSKSAAGPDHIPAILLKNLALAISKPLALIFHSSFESGNLPHVWKTAIVSPIPKKKCNLSLPNSYRPISLTCITCKLMESIINKKLKHLLISNNLITPSQFGYMPRKSTQLQLLSCMKDWTNHLDKHVPVDVIYLDFSKAFDSVSHDLLIFKLKRYNIEGKLLNWLKSFLTNRQFCVKVENSLSDWTNVTSGVPQGSVLGPLLFLIYINDITSNIKCNVKIFADDVKLYSPIHNSDSSSLQSDLNKVLEWSKTWMLPLNLDKCNILHLGHSNKKAIYSLDNKPLKPIDEILDLGIYIDSKLKFTTHCQHLAAKCSRMVGCIFRTFSSRKKSIILQAYHTYVLPLLNYCSSVWRPHLVGNIEILEKIQRRFTKRLLQHHSQQLDYSQRLQHLGLATVHEHLLKNDLCQLYHIYHKDTCLDNFLTHCTSCTRGSLHKLSLATCHSDYIKFSFPQRIILSWNQLPTEIVKSGYNRFKNYLNDRNLSN